MTKPRLHKSRKSILETTGTPIAGGRTDGREGLGFGILKPKFSKPTPLANEFPYDGPDPYEDAPEPDEETLDAVTSKGLNFAPSDSFHINKPRPFYFAEGLHNLVDCFLRPDLVLDEIAAFGDSMSAVPQLSRNNSAGTSGGASFSYPGGGGTNFKRTGTTRG